jgi:hypothetical protein
MQKLFLSVVLQLQLFISAIKFCISYHVSEGSNLFNRHLKRWVAKGDGWLSRHMGG